MIFNLLLFFWATATTLLWRQAHRRAAFLPAFPRRLYRGLFAAFYLIVLGYLILPLSRPFLETEPLFTPDLWATVAYLWYPLVLQVVIGLAVSRWTWQRVKRLLVRRPGGSGRSVPQPAPAGDKVGLSSQLTRRGAIGLAASFAAPAATLALAAIASRQLGQFRVRRVTLTLPALPPDLDGITVAHMTDLHAGHFLDAEAAARLAETVNGLKTDLVAFTGDLIDRGLLSRLPIAMRFLANLDRRYGFAMIEGNHDLHEDAQAFEQDLRGGAYPLLLDEEMTVRIPGRATPVQFLGLSWGMLAVSGEPGLDFGAPRRPGRRWTPEWAEASTRQVAALRRPDAFPILLAHHPHTVLPAAEHNLPLVLAGHTHGGQLMLTDHIGAGPIRFKYWSGEHQVGSSTLVICNGIGGWFPLRVNAPAEVVHLTLRTAAR